MIPYVFERTGEVIKQATESHVVQGRINNFIQNPKRIFDLIERAYCKFITKFLPSAFRMQNISFTQVGEKHTWVYDFYSIYNLLDNTGFEKIQKMTCETTNISGFPLFPLDLLENGHPRKGLESMYIEAVKN
jgi:hypothetical protein